MRYHFQNGVQQKKRRGKSLLFAMPVIALFVGCYAAFNAVSPMLAAMPGIASAESTEDRLKDAPGEHGNRIFIPQINVNLAIIKAENGTSAVGGAWHHVSDAGDPVKGGNFVLSAQRFSLGMTPGETRMLSPFYNIDKLEVGHQLFVDYDGQRYGYEVIEKNSAVKDKAELEASSVDAKMTLYPRTADGDADGASIVARPLGEVQKLQSK